MKKVLILFLFAACLIPGKVRSQQPDHEGSLVQWMTLTEALKKNETQPKPIILDFYTDWCGWCKHMMKTTYADPNLSAYINTYFYPAKFDAEGKDTIEYLGVKYYPTSAQPRSPHGLAIKLLQGRLSYPTTLFLNAYDKEKKEFKLNMLAAGYLETRKLEPILIFTLENVFRNCNYDDFREEYEKAFFDSTLDLRLNDQMKWKSPKEYFTAVAKPESKKTIVYLNSDWCNACKVMKRTSFIDSTVYPYLMKKYNLVDFNPENMDSLYYKSQLYTNPKNESTPLHQLAFLLSKGSINFPSVCILDENQNILDVIPSYLPPTLLDDILHYYGDDINKVKSWQDFMASRKK